MAMPSTARRLHEVACAGRHLPAAIGTSSDKVELAYIYTQSSATLIQQTQDHAYSSCCHTILGACVHHCTKHEQVPRGFTAAELSLIMSVLVDQAYKYMMSIKATAHIPLAVATASPTVQAFAAAAPVGVRSASDKLRQGQVGATDVWTALRAKVSSELKPAKEPTGFEHLLKSPTATGAHGEYTYSKAAVSKGIASWPIPADVKAKVQESVGSVILVAKSVDYRSFTLKVKGSSSVLHEVACAGRHLPAANGTSSDNVELAYIYTQSSATLIQQTQDHSYKYCCYKLLWAICTHHCTRHEQVKRGCTPAELSLIMSVLVDQAYKYMISIKAAAYIPVAAVAPAMLVTQATVVAAPVTQESLRAASASLRHKAESASIASALVANVVRRGFETFTQEGVVETLTYESAKVTELTPIVQKILGAPKDCANDIAMALLGGSFVTDSGGTQWSHHTLTYSVAGDKSGGGSTNFAQFVVRVAKSNPKQRTLFLFSLKTSFALVPDLIYLRSCSASAGFLGLGSRNDCTDVPTAIPHTLDLASLNVLDSYLTAVGLGLISAHLPNAESMSLLASRPHLLDRQVPAEFEGVLAALRGRLARDRQAAQCESGCSESVRKIVHGALSKWSSSLEVQSMQKLTPDGAPQFIKYLATSCHVADPAFVKVLGSVLASEKPVVFSTLSCDKSDRCKYLLLVGNSTVGVATDLLIVQQAATFGLAPDLVVVRAVRQLLSMQSGIPDFDTAKPCMNSPGCLPTDPLRKALYTTPNRSYTPSELMTVPWVAHQFKDCKSRLPIGPAFCYSSTNFMLLGLILAAHADVPAKDPWTHFDQGMFLPESVRKELQFVKHGPPSAYTPVHGYDRTAYNVPAGEHNDHDNWHVDGVFSGWTASNLVATATAVADLAWEVYGPRYSVAPQAYVKQMIPSPKSLYGLATFNLGQITGHKGDYGIAYGHVGATYGYQSIVAYFPKFGVSMTVATNIETDFQAQPMDTMCFAFNAAVGYMLNRTIRCTFSSRGYWSGNCRCDPIDDQVWV